MVSSVIEIVNKTGLHTRPGNQFVKLAKRFECDIIVKKGGAECNAKSLLKLLKVGISFGDTIEICCTGSDEDGALEALCSYVAALTE